MSFKTALIGLCAVLLIAGCGDEDGTNPTGGGPAGKLYVLNQGDNTMYVYDTETLARIDSVDTQVDKPHYIEFAPSGEHFYITTLEATAAFGHFAKYEAGAMSFVGSKGLPSAVLPSAIAITADSRYGYICDFSGADRGFIHKYDLTTMTWIKQLQSGATTHDLKITSDGATIVACNRLTDDITIIETATDDVSFVKIDPDRDPQIDGVMHGPFGVAIDHKDSLAFIACVTSHQVRFLDLATREIVDSITLPMSVTHAIAGPTLMAVSPDNDVVYVTTQVGNSLVVFRVSTKEILADISFVDGDFASPSPFGITMSDDGSRVYVACIGVNSTNGRVYIIDGNNQTNLGYIEVGKQSYGLIWQPE